MHVDTVMCVGLKFMIYFIVFFTINIPSFSETISDYIWNNHSSMLNHSSKHYSETPKIPKLKDVSLRDHNGRNLTKIKRQYFCGTSDIMIPSLSQSHNNTIYNNNTRIKRYVLQGSKWEKLALTWAVVTPSRKPTVVAIADEEFAKALEVWSKVSKLNFNQVHPQSSDIDIKVKFSVNNHGDGYDFDGNGGTLAHAFYPGEGIGGDVHFDDTEEFMRHNEIAGSENGISLYITAAHEVGHSLGLRHSDKRNSLMAPFYNEYDENFALPDDDMSAIRSMYGNPEHDRPYHPRPFTTAETTTTTTTSTTTSTTAKHRPIHPTRPINFPVTPTKSINFPTPTKSINFPVTPTRPRTRPPKFTTPVRPRIMPTTPKTIQPPVRKKPSRPKSKPRYPSECDIKSKKTNEKPDLCDGNFDAATQIGAEIMLFRAEYLWRVSRYSNRYEFLQYRIDIMFTEIMSFGIKSVDAAYTLEGDKGVVLFSNSTVLVIKTGERAIKYHLKDLNITTTDHIDAAWRWGHNGHVYLLSGEQYWRLDSCGNTQEDYPRNSAVWQGLPQNVSAALTYGGKTYFFADNVFWEFDNMKMRAKTPPYLSAPYWLQCPHPNLGDRQYCGGQSTLHNGWKSFQVIWFIVLMLQFRL